MVDCVLFYLAEMHTKTGHLCILRNLNVNLCFCLRLALGLNLILRAQCIMHNYTAYYLIVLSQSN